VPYLNITSVKVDLGGVTYIDNYPKSRIASRKARGEIASNVVTTSSGISQDNFQNVVIDWGVEPEFARLKDTGACNFAELRGSRITVTYVGGNIRLNVTHEYFQNVLFSPGSGGGSLGRLSLFSNN
jgi:hypothetical protein